MVGNHRRMETRSAASRRPSSQKAMPAGTRRRRIVKYIADQGGELRSESGQGLRRQICDAIGDRPTPVSQALIALEKAGLLEREIDVERRRCHAIRLVARPEPGPPDRTEERGGAPSPRGADARLAADRKQARSELEAAERELTEAIRRAAEASRRVRDLRWALIRFDAPDGSRAPTGPFPTENTDDE